MKLKLFWPNDNELHPVVTTIHAIYSVMKTTRNYTTYLILFNLFVFTGSVFIGRYPISVPDILSVIGHVFGSDVAESHQLIHTVIFKVRIPRIMIAMVIGAGLGITGATFQGVFKNPLVSPYILGVSSGGGFGAALAILLCNDVIWIQLSAFVFGMIAVGLSLLTARLGFRMSTYTLVLSGIVVGSFFSAMISLLKYVADTYTKLPAIVFWLMGSLAAVNVRDMLITAPVTLICIGVLIMLRWRINILSLGSGQARELGLNTTALYITIITCSTMIASSIVAVAGIIGWVGLVVPHLCRMIVGADHTRLLPASALMGSAYMLIVDDVARASVGQEIPLGIVTAVIGAPFFAYLLRRNQGGKG